MHFPHDLTEKNSMKIVESFMSELFKRFKNKIPEMCPLTQIQIDDENLKEKRAWASSKWFRS